MHTFIMALPLVLHMTLAKPDLSKLFDKVFIHQKSQPKIHQIYKQHRQPMTFEGCV